MFCFNTSPGVYAGEQGRHNIFVLDRASAHAHATRRRGANHVIERAGPRILSRSSSSEESFLCTPRIRYAFFPTDMGRDSHEDGDREGILGPASGKARKRACQCCFPLRDPGVNAGARIVLMVCRLAAHCPEAHRLSLTDDESAAVFLSLRFCK
ncbi:MAG: hypothetical protein MI923_09325 [Phycisphaerales bacterium]|nr:hypothetical protein [Phycisphaerales bacterium]